MKSFLQFALRGYKRWLSPTLLTSCRYVPTCSDYALESMERHGTMIGTWFVMLRVLRCNPLSRGGFDPVPDFSLLRKAEAAAATPNFVAPCNRSSASRAETGPISPTVGIIARN